MVLQYITHILSKPGDGLRQNIFSINCYIACIRFNQTIQHAQSGCFAAAACAQQYKGFTFFYFKRNLIDGLYPVKSFTYIICDDHNNNPKTGGLYFAY